MTRTDATDVERELRRIGVDQMRLGGLATSGSITSADLLAWLRGLPTGLGHKQFMDALSHSGPTPGLAAEGVPPRDSTFHTPDLDLRQAFARELERVLPRGSYQGGWAIIDQIDKGAAVAKLRKLPDNAGWDAVAAIIPIVHVDEKEQAP